MIDHETPPFLRGARFAPEPKLRRWLRSRECAAYGVGLLGWLLTVKLGDRYGLHGLWLAGLWFIEFMTMTGAAYVWLLLLEVVTDERRGRVIPGRRR